MENVTLTPKEQMRVQVLNSLLAEQIALDQAAELMGVSTRHARRITTAYREEGAAALAHGHRGRKPVNATPEAVIADVVRLAGTRYQGANHTHLSELLSEREGIDIGRTTLRRILLDAGLSSPRRRRPPKHRVRRQRMPRAGMLIQLDGSYHRWLGDHSPPFTLLLAVDDATGSVVNTLFCQQEDSHNYFLLMQNVLRRCGIRHAVFKHTPGSGSTGTPTQFGRAMAELGIQMIFARSPQAKGRVERAAGTFQDRLITELRLAGATTIEQAKAVLKQFLPSVLIRHSDPCRRICAWAKSCASNTKGEWPGTTPCSSSGTPCSCCLTGNAAAMPVRLSWCCTDWTAGCRYNMRDASSPSRRRPPVQDRCETASRLSLVMPSSLLTPKASVNLGKRPLIH